jgi:hypothetical protein
MIVDTTIVTNCIALVYYCNTAINAFCIEAKFADVLLPTLRLPEILVSPNTGEIAFVFTRADCKDERFLGKFPAVSNDFWDFLLTLNGV